MPDLKCYRCNSWPCECADGCTVLWGDCREIVADLPLQELLLTDPPYGISLDTKYSQRKSKVIGRNYDAVTGDSEVGDYGFLFSLAKWSVVFGANNWPQQLTWYNPQKDGWIVWDKRTNEAADKILGSPFELAVVAGRRLYKIIRIQHCGVKNADGDHSGRFHPTQKPKIVFRKILEYFPKCQSFIDPFLGSGSSLLAAKQLGRRAIGIEIEEKYCEIAANRLANESNPGE